MNRYAALAAAFAFATSIPAAEWNPVAVPPGAALPEADSLWYRCHVRVPDNMVVPAEKDLWRDSMNLALADIPGSAVVWLNGQKIIEAREIPPGPPRRFKVPKGIFEKGAFNCFAIELTGASAKRGLTAPAVFSGYFDELTMDRWQVAAAKPEPGELKALPDQPGAASYTESNMHEARAVLGATTEPHRGKQVPPGEALALLETDEDLVVEQLLHEPLVAQPTHVSYDERGRMWVAQYRQYPYPAGITMISRDKYYRSKYDRVPPPPPNHDRGADIVSVHEDADGDGIYENHKVVLGGLNMANAALRGYGGIWVMQTPYLLFYPDADGDDAPDGEPEVRLAGFGLEDTHSVANGLAWGPDGWLYGAQGSTTTSRVTRPNIDPKDAPGIYNEGCMIWRYHPRTQDYEMFADGSGNTFGPSFDAEGRLFSGHNGGDTRGWHHIQSGLYLKQGKDPGKFGPPPNPFAYGEMPMMKSANPVPRFSHMTLPASGTALPARLRGAFLAADPLHHYVVAAERRRDGSTLSTADLGFILRTEDETFRPVYLANAPDGSVTVADFREEFIAHGQNYQGQIDPATGRIYRLRGKAEPQENDVDLSGKSDADLVALLRHPNAWHRLTAVRLLGERRAAASAPALVALLGEGGAHPALEAVWALHQIGRFDEGTALRALDHPAPMVRAWAIRLLGDARALPANFFDKAKALAASEPDAEVRAQVLSTARRLPAAQALPLAAALIARSEDLGDPFIPLMAWFTVEQNCADHRAEVLALFAKGSPLWSAPLARQEIIPRLMRRFAEGGSRGELLACAALLGAAPPDAKADLMAGFERAFEGRGLPDLPEALEAALADAGAGSLALRVRRADAAAIAEALALTRNNQAAAPGRLSAIRALGDVAPAAAEEPLLAAALDPAAAEPIRAAAAAALSRFASPAIGERLAAAYPSLPPALRTAALNLLGSRAAWSADLLRACQSGTIPRSDLPADLVARLRLHPGDDVSALIAKLFPSDAEGTRSNAAGKIAAVRAVVEAGAGDPYRGEPIYAARCAACHRLFFKGGSIGPDLTPYQREDLGTVLPSILDPSGEIREGFENYLAQTKDGRVLGGFLADEDANAIVLRGFDGADHTIPRDQVTRLTPAGRSLMPDGLLDGLSDQELRDFFAYLRIPQPISR